MRGEAKAGIVRLTTGPTAPDAPIRAASATASLTPTATPTAPPGISARTAPYLTQVAHFRKDTVEAAAWAPDGQTLALGGSLGITLYGDADPAAKTQLYRTSDGGETWTLLLAAGSLPLDSELRFLDAQTGYAYWPWNWARPYAGYP